MNRVLRSALLAIPVLLLVQGGAFGQSQRGFDIFRQPVFTQWPVEWSSPHQVDVAIDHDWAGRIRGLAFATGVPATIADPIQATVGGWLVAAHCEAGRAKTRFSFTRGGDGKCAAPVCLEVPTSGTCDRCPPSPDNWVFDYPREARRLGGLSATITLRVTKDAEGNAEAVRLLTGFAQKRGGGIELFIADAAAGVDIGDLPPRARLVEVYAESAARTLRNYRAEGGQRAIPHCLTLRYE